MKTNGIIQSIIDTDLYKLSMGWFVLQHYPEFECIYSFNNRSKNMVFTQEAVNEIMRNVELMSKLKLTDGEYDWMKNNLPFLPVA